MLRNDELTKLGCTLDTPVQDFWQKIAGRTWKQAPADMVDICTKIAAIIEDDYTARRR